MSEITLIVNGNKSNVAYKNGDSILHAINAHGGQIIAACGGNGTCGKCQVIVDGRRQLACQCRACEGQVVEMATSIDADSHMHRLEAASGDCDIAIDIGTTTINAAAYNARGNIVATYNTLNTQSRYGSDVIARISAANSGQLATMQSLVVDIIDQIISAFASNGYLKSDYKIYIAANTVMMHILFNCDCSSLGVAPYTPVFVDSRQVLASEVGLSCDNMIITLPCISGYVGADIVAGLHYVGMPQRDKFNVLIDLGTNAEIAVFGSDMCQVTAAAAGPCFEGAGISCGMSATHGAITSARYDRDKIICQTVDNVEPQGVCGTGLIDLIAIMWQTNAFDEYGTFEADGDYHISTNITLVQQDIRQFQLAKSAIVSALTAMLVNADITYDDIDTIYISGGFSTKLNLQSAIDVGMLSSSYSSKYVAVASSCLHGIIKYAVEGGELDKLARSAQYIDLSMDKVFVSHFIENLNFDKVNNS